MVKLEVTMKVAFWICLVIWIGGGVLGQVTGDQTIHAISVNIFGLITIALGLFMLGGWLWRKLSTAGDGRSLRNGMPIMSMTGVDPKAAEVCERAVQADAFKPMAKNADGSEIIHIQSPHQDYLAVVEVVDGAIHLQATYTTSPDKLEHDLAELREVLA